MPLEIRCPSADDNIRVVSGSGGGTVCVHGRVTETFDKGGHHRGTVPLLQGNTSIRVRVVAHHVDDPTTVDPTGPGFVDTSTDSTTWCATGVPVPGLGDLTAVAWERVLGSGSTFTFVRPTGVQFTGVSDGTARDCCTESACSSSSSSGSQLAELAGNPALEVSVPDGANAGCYPAQPTGPQTWVVSVGGADYQLFLDPGAGLVIRSGSFLAPCATLDVEPFSATFPGEVFGASAEVVVTLA
jgi:hypothetical protein